jgi:hypothetical protein
MQGKDKIMRPSQGGIYTLNTIMTKLELSDSPCLMVEIDGRMCPIQDSHISQDDLLGIEGFKFTSWRYKYTTHEWVPVFHALDSSYVMAYMTKELLKEDWRTEEDDTYWIVPKAYPRSQS